MYAIRSYYECPVRRGGGRNLLRRQADDPGQPSLVITSYSIHYTKLYDQALALSPDYVLAHYRLGQAYMKLKRPQQAADSFREVLRLAPDSELARSVTEYLKILK